MYGEAYGYEYEIEEYKGAFYWTLYSEGDEWAGGQAPTLEQARRDAQRRAQSEMEG